MKPMEPGTTGGQSPGARRMRAELGREGTCVPLVPQDTANREVDIRRPHQYTVSYYRSLVVDSDSGPFRGAVRLVDKR
jgi:hypothetical protein